MGRYFKDGDPDWRRIEAMARRGFERVTREAQGFGEGIGQANWGGGLRAGRMLASGDLRLVALYYIERQPRHGYDLIKAVEEASKGVYSPSPGIVYPALTYLEEAGLATSEAEANKKLYTITDAGRTHLAENREAVESTLAFLGQAGEQVNRFRGFAQRGKADADRGGDAPSGWWHADATASSSASSGPSFTSGDDASVDAEFEAARKALKAAIRRVREGSAPDKRRAAEILRSTADLLGAPGSR